jgi:hypothetical protein
VDRRHAEEAAKQFTDKGKTPEVFTDFRKLMQRSDIHIIVNGTPDHWHTLVNILAVNTGKDVYSEKPLTLTIDEGQLVSRAKNTRFSRSAASSAATGISGWLVNWCATGGWESCRRWSSGCPPARVKVRLSRFPCRPK